MSLIPVPGVGAIDILLQAPFQRRSNMLLTKFSEQITTLQEEKIDREYLNSEAWLDLMLQAIDTASRTRHQEKIQLYARILAAAVPIQDRLQHSPEEYLSVLAQMTQHELALSQAIYEQQKEQLHEGESHYDWLHRIGACHEYEYESEFTGGYRADGTTRKMEKKTRWTRPVGDWPAEDHDFLILRLQALGLVRALNEYVLWSGSETFVITEPFRKIMDYVAR